MIWLLYFLLMNDSLYLLSRAVVFAIFLVAASPSIASEPVLSVEDVSLSEGAGLASVRVTISEPCDKFTRISWTTRYGNAVSGKDFLAKSGRITFAPGQTEKTISILLVDDDIDEPDQFFRIFFRNPAGISVPANYSSRVFITDDDPEPTIKFLRTEQEVTEGTNEASVANVGIRLSHRSEKTIRFTVYTAGNTASELEFNPVAIRAVFDSPGVFDFFPIEINADADLEGRQQFYLYMRNPNNAELDLTGSTIERDDRIRTKIKILDDDVLDPPPQIFSDNSFTWIGTFGRKFTEDELDTIAANSALVVLAKFHALFDIEAHHAAATELLSRNPDLKIYPYFNSKFWFLESDWNTQPDPDWLLKDANGDFIVFDTDRSAANYLDLRIPECRSWMLATIESWMSTGLYEGIAFDSTGPVGDFAEGTYWQDVLGGQTEVDAWNAGMAAVIKAAQESPTIGSTIVNGISDAAFRGPDRDLFQLDYSEGALNERFAVNTDGAVVETLMEDLQLMQEKPDRILLMKTNIHDKGDAVENQRRARFAYGCFLMGWIPGSSFFKVAIDDFYTTSELEDYPVQRQYDLGLPLGNFFVDESLLIRDFEFYRVVVNLSGEEQTFQNDHEPMAIPSNDAVFINISD